MQSEREYFWGRKYSQGEIDQVITCSRRAQSQQLILQRTGDSKISAGKQEGKPKFSVRNASDCTHVKGDPATIHSGSRIKMTRSQWQRSPWQNWAPNITIQNLFFCTTSAHRNSPCISRVAMWMQAVATAES